MKIKHWIIKKLGGTPYEDAVRYTINKISPTVYTVESTFVYDIHTDRQLPKDFLIRKLVDNMSDELTKYIEVTDGIKVGMGKAECRARLCVVKPIYEEGVDERN